MNLLEWLKNHARKGKCLKKTPDDSIPEPKASWVVGTSPDVLQVNVRVCPYCQKAPFLDFPIIDETWTWKIHCGNSDCPYQPRGKYISIRKSQRFDTNKITIKLNLLCEKWNAGSNISSEQFIKINISLKKLNEWQQKKIKRMYFYDGKWHLLKDIKV